MDKMKLQHEGSNKLWMQQLVLVTDPTSSFKAPTFDVLTVDSGSAHDNLKKYIVWTFG